MCNASNKKVITIYDIAREAGVSAATVSRVLTNSANVRREKKEKILGLIDKYHFTPNALAKGLSDTKSNIIGILAADIRNPYYAEVFVACENAAREAGYTVWVCNSLGQKESEIRHIQMMNQQRVDAIIQLGGKVDDIISDPQYVEKINSLTAQIPMVVTGKLDGTNCYQVQIDAGRAAELLMEHLLSLGHRKIALVGGRRDVTSTYQKYITYRKLLQQYEVEYREDYVVDGGYDFDTGYSGIRKLLEKDCPPTAVIAINDLAAAGVVRGIREHGLTVPDDISLVSYDNTLTSEIIAPKLTGIDYGYKAYGKMLVNTAIALIEKREVPHGQLLEPALVIKESTAKAKE